MARISLETSNYFSVLSDSDVESDYTESTQLQTRQERIPPIVIYSYINNHTKTLQT